MSWPTVRRYARTLDDAFRGVDYATAIHRTGPPVPFGERIAGVIVATVVGVLIACALVHWWTGVNT
jgi:hypothetical protein